MSEKKKYYYGYTEAQKKSAEKYLAKFESLKVRVVEDEKQRIQQAAKASGKSVNQYMIDCALQEAERIIPE